MGTELRLLCLDTKHFTNWVTSPWDSPHCWINEPAVYLLPDSLCLVSVLLTPWLLTPSPEGAVKTQQELGGKIDHNSWFQRDLSHYSGEDMAVLSLWQKELMQRHSLWRELLLSPTSPKGATGFRILPQAGERMLKIGVCKEHFKPKLLIVPEHFLDIKYTFLSLPP